MNLLIKLYFYLCYQCYTFLSVWLFQRDWSQREGQRSQQLKLKPEYHKQSANLSVLLKRVTKYSTNRKTQISSLIMHSMRQEVNQLSENNKNSEVMKTREIPVKWPGKAAREEVTRKHSKESLLASMKETHWLSG